MNKVVLIALFSIVFITFAKAEEITLFDKKGEAVAYIAMDREMTIYMWDGEPVAYLVNKGSSEDPKVDLFSIYGFNGKHLGWLDKGIIRDHEGLAVGFIKGAINMSTSSQPSKSSKSSKPSKSSKESTPSKPSYSNSWSGIPLKYFLKEGIE